MRNKPVSSWLLSELKRFVSQVELSLGYGDQGNQVIWELPDRRCLECKRLDNGMAIVEPDSELYWFIVNASELVFGNTMENIKWSGGSGPSLDGQGLERLIIANELCIRFREERFWKKWREDVTNVLSFFSQTSQSRYEKSVPQLTVAYYPEDLSESDENYGVLGKSLLDNYKAFLRLFRDSSTVVVVKRECKITEILDNQRFDANQDSLSLSPIPPRLAHLQQLTKQDQGKGPVIFKLNANASMEILVGGRLVFRKVNNVWHFLTITKAKRQVIDALGNMGNELVAHNFLTLGMDLADRGEGALLFLCKEPTSEVMGKLVQGEDSFIRSLPGLPYQELPARIRFTQMVGRRKLTLGKNMYHEITPLLREVASIDGATIFSYEGKLLAFGSIIKLGVDQSGRNSGPQPEGARLAATHHISKWGIAIKASSDGDAVLYIGGNSVGQIF